MAWSRLVAWEVGTVARFETYSEANLTGFANGLDVGKERMKGIRMFGLSDWKDGDGEGCGETV